VEARHYLRCSPASTTWPVADAFTAHHILTGLLVGTSLNPEP
jgi:hypothetical protein